MLKHGFSNDAITNTTIKPIIKDKMKLSNDSDNYRAIAPNGSFAKILDYIIIASFPDVFRSSDQQFAYKSKSSTTMCTFMVIETIQYYRKNGSDVYVTLLDCSKALDLVRFDKLFKLLLYKSMCPLVIRLLINMYLNAMYCISCKDAISENFSVNNGVKQGGVMSPLLFTLYTDPLIEDLIISNFGCYMGDKCASVFVYADDIILLSPTKYAMQKLLDKCATYADEFDLIFNPLKCKTILFSDNLELSSLYIENAPMSMGETEKHLGHWLSSRGDYIKCDNISKDLKVRSNCIKREFVHLSYATKCMLFNVQCSSSMPANKSLIWAIYVTV